MYGLSLLDIMVIIVYFAGMIGIGLWAMRRIKNQEDYFLAGRRFGKVIQTFAAFGQSTTADNSVGAVTTTFTNWTRDDPRQRYEVEFQVSYDTDIEIVPDLITNAVKKHPQILDEPEPVDTELRGFGDSGIDFCVEFWVNGIDDGKNKYSSDVLFLVWNALKENDIEIPYPHRVVEIKGPMPT